MSISAMKQALEALEQIHPGNMTPMAEEAWNKSITALRQAIAEAEKREWAGLTKEEVDSWELPDCPTVFEFVQFIEAKIKEKNNG